MSKHLKKVNIQRKFYAMTTTDDNSAVITMYGDIVEQQPTDLYGDPIEGSYIIQDEFLKDLDSVSDCSCITIRMNSCGGDASVAIMIHNRLRELAAKGTKLICIVDGVAMSGGSLIMCACDTVKVNPSSLIMIHKCWTFLFGGYNADELRKLALSNDAYDKAQATIYSRKSGLSEAEIIKMMANVTYLTGREAVERGFADEVLEDCEPLEIAAGADGRSLYLHGRKVCLTPGLFAPDSIPTVKSENFSVKTNTEQSVKTDTKKGGNKLMTPEELRRDYPEAVAQIESNAAEAAGRSAVEAEQRRLQEIDEVSSLFGNELVREAKYGEHSCTAQELAYRAAKKAAKDGQSFFGSLKKDSLDSGTANVTATANGGISMSTQEQKDADIQKVTDIYKKSKGGI